jgi:hypothetical protein
MLAGMAPYLSVATIDYYFFVCQRASGRRAEWRRREVAVRKRRPWVLIEDSPSGTLPPAEVVYVQCDPSWPGGWWFVVEDGLPGCRGRGGRRPLE